MNILFHPSSLEHDTGMHPENKKRIEVFGKLPVTDPGISTDYIQLIHTEEYICRVKQASEQSLRLDQDTATSPGTYEAAVIAANLTVMAAENNDFALVRPPGHHAYPDKSSGFCIFNNVAIAAQKLALEGKKVLIFDFDGHLGDGTSKIFYDSNRVMYWSIHQHPAFPGHGLETEIGEGEGKGYTINMTLPPASGDDVFLDAVYHILPIVKKFKPDVVAISAGFDSHKTDLLLELNLSTTIYYKLGQMLAENFSRIFATLEGGYNIDVLPKCVYNFMAGINDQKIMYEDQQTETLYITYNEYDNRFNNLMSQLNQIWT